MEIVRLYSEKSVEADPDLLLSISEMGFDESSVREALVATHNSKSAAVSICLRFDGIDYDIDCDPSYCFVYIVRMVARKPSEKCAGPKR